MKNKKLSIAIYIAIIMVLCMLVRCCAFSQSQPKLDRIRYGERYYLVQYKTSYISGYFGHICLTAYPRQSDLISFAAQISKSIPSDVVITNVTPMAASDFKSFIKQRKSWQTKKQFISEW